MAESVWERSGSDDVSANTFNLIIGLTLFWGFALNFVMLKFIPVSFIQSIPMFWFLIAYFVTCIAGIALIKASENPVVSFIGYNLIVVPFGLVLNLIVSKYAPGTVLNAITATAIQTVAMMALSTAFPQWFENLGPVLFIALLGAIVIEVLMIIITGHSATWIDWIVAIIFCGYIGFDWWRANNVPKTIDNAIDCAASLYMDIINLFVRILSIFGKK